MDEDLIVAIHTFTQLFNVVDNLFENSGQNQFFRQQIDPLFRKVYRSIHLIRDLHRRLLDITNVNGFDNIQEVQRLFDFEFVEIEHEYQLFIRNNRTNIPSTIEFVNIPNGTEEEILVAGLQLTDLTLQINRNVYLLCRNLFRQFRVVHLLQLFTQVQFLIGAHFHNNIAVINMFAFELLVNIPTNDDGGNGGNGGNGGGGGDGGDGGDGGNGGNEDNHENGQNGHNVHNSP